MANTALEIEWDHFVHSPSRKDGIPEHVEKHLRSDSCTFIDEFGKKESLGGKIRLLACSLFHTFYLRVSFKSFPRWESAVACLIIAAKIENKVQTIKKITRSAAHYLRPHLHFNDPKKRTLPPQQFYHWMSQIHIRERQIIERLYGELRTILPIHFLKLSDLKLIIIDKNQRQLTQKNKHLSNVFRGCFEVLRKIFRSVLCIFYPPPWLAAVAVFKSLRKYNKDRLNEDKQKEANYKKPPKLYLTNEWFKTYDDAEQTLDLNTIQYISDEIDACDDNQVSVKDYTTKPAELNGIKDLAVLKRINLVRTTPFNRLPIQIRDDLRACFKLKKKQFIDLRSDIIKKIEAENKQIRFENDNNNNNNSNNMEIDSDNTSTPNKSQRQQSRQNEITPPHSATKLSSPPTTTNEVMDVSSDWIIGNRPKQKTIIKQLMAENKKLKKTKLAPNPNLEEGEIEDEEEDININHNNNINKRIYRKRKRKRNQWRMNNQDHNDNMNTFRNKNSNKNFQTKSNQRRKRNMAEELYHCGLETYQYVKNGKNNNNDNRNDNNNNNNNNNNNRNNNDMVIDEDSDLFYMNWCTQSFEFDENDICISEKPEIEGNDKSVLNGIVYRIPTPNYMPTGNTPNYGQQGVSPITPGYPGYGISPMSTSYGGTLTPQQQQQQQRNNNNNNNNNNNKANNEEEEYWKRSYGKYENEDDLNDASVSSFHNDDNIDNIGNNTMRNTHSFTTKTQRNNNNNNNNNYQTTEPPHKKMKMNHHRQ